MRIFVFDFRDLSKNILIDVIIIVVRNVNLFVFDRIMYFIRIIELYFMGILVFNIIVIDFEGVRIRCYLIRFNNLKIFNSRVNFEND